jgi:glutathione peroxidase
MGKICFKTSFDKVKDIPSDLWSIKLKDIDGHSKTLNDYKRNKKIFIFVNVACKCSLTNKNYKKLVQLYKDYQYKGLEILGFPSRDFFFQEFSLNSKIKSYVKDKFKVEFPILEISEVNGKRMHPVYKYLKTNSELNCEKGLKNIPWNFTKFLVDSDGKVIKYYKPDIDLNVLENDIIKLLK